MLRGTQIKQHLYCELHKLCVMCDENAAHFFNRIFKYLIRKLFQLLPLASEILLR